MTVEGPRPSASEADATQLARVGKKLDATDAAERAAEEAMSAFMDYLEEQTTVHGKFFVKLGENTEENDGRVIVLRSPGKLNEYDEGCKEKQLAVTKKGVMLLIGPHGYEVDIEDKLNYVIDDWHREEKPSFTLQDDTLLLRMMPHHPDTPYKLSPMYGDGAYQMEWVNSALNRSKHKAKERVNKALDRANLARGLMKT